MGKCKVRPRHGKQNNNIMDLKVIGWEVMD